MNDSTLYPKLPPIYMEELDYSPNQSQSTVIIETPVTCGKENQDSCAEELKTKDIKKDPIIELGHKISMSFFICSMGFFLLSLPFLIYAFVKARDRSYWID